VEDIIAGEIFQSEFDEGNGRARYTGGPLQNSKDPQIFTGGRQGFLPFPLP